MQYTTLKCDTGIIFADIACWGSCRQNFWDLFVFSFYESSQKKYKRYILLEILMTHFRCIYLNRGVYIRLRAVLSSKLVDGRWRFNCRERLTTQPYGLFRGFLQNSCKYGLGSLGRPTQARVPHSKICLIAQPQQTGGLILFFVKKTRDNRISASIAWNPFQFYMKY